MPSLTLPSSSSTDRQVAKCNLSACVCVCLCVQLLDAVPDTVTCIRVYTRLLSLRTSNHVPPGSTATAPLLRTLRCANFCSKRFQGEA